MCTISDVKVKLEDRRKTWMFLGYVQDYTVGTYRILNMRTKFIVLSRDVIWLNKTYEDCVSRKDNTKADSYILQNEDNYYKWDHLKIYPVKNKVRTENVKT